MKPADSRHVLASAKGGGFLAIGNAFEIGSRFVIAFLLARALGAEGWGLYSLAVSAGTLFSGISRLGLDDAMVRYLAIFRRRGDHASVIGTLQVALTVSLSAAVLISAVLYLAADRIALGLFESAVLGDLLRVFAVIVPFMTLTTLLVSAAKGFKRMDYAALAENVVMSVARVVLLAALLASGLDVLVAVVVFGISDAAAALTLVVLVNKIVPLRELWAPGGNRRYGELLRFALPLWLSSLMSLFRKNIEVLILGVLTVAANVGVFALVARVNLVSVLLFRAITTGVKPILAELHGEQEREELHRIYRASTRWTLMFSLPIFLVTVLYPRPILGIFGSAFTVGAGALVILSFAQLAEAATGTCGSLIDMTGHTRAKLVNSVLWLALLVGGSLYAIPRWGVIGAASVSLVATAVVNVLRVIEVWVLEGMQPWDRSFVKPVVAAVAAYMFGVVLDSLGTGVVGVPRLLAASVAVTAVYAGMSWALGVAEDDRLVLRRGVRRAERFVRRSSHREMASAESL